MHWASSLRELNLTNRLTHRRHRVRQRGQDCGEVQLVRGPRVPQHVLSGEVQGHAAVEGSVDCDENLAGHLELPVYRVCVVGNVIS